MGCNMKKTNMVGMSCFLGGFFMFGWRKLGDFMGSSGKLSQKSGMDEVDYSGQLRMVDVFPEGNFDFIDSITWQWLHDSVNYLVTMDLWLLLVIVGAILLVIGGVFIKK